MPEGNIEEIVYETLEELNEILPPEKKLTKSRETTLYGNSNALTSLQLVNFIAMLEEKLETKLGKRVTVVSEKAMSQKNSPFRNIKSLVDYIQTLIS